MATKMSAAEFETAMGGVKSALAKAEAAADAAATAAQNGAADGFGGVGGAAEAVLTLKADNTKSFTAINDKIGELAQAFSVSADTATKQEQATAQAFNDFAGGGSN